MGCLASLLLLSACSSEENVADMGNKIDVAKGIRFQFTEEAFVPGEVAAAKQGTRAMTEPKEIDLGNGIIAEATLEPDTAGCAQTRAGNLVPDGTYKIYAIDASGTRHDGLTGTMTSGVFTPNNRWELESGTYTFVCINSAVTDNGNELYAKLNHEDGMPLIGVSDPIAVNNPFDVLVPFVMRHQQARVRYQFISYTEPMESLTLNWLNSDLTYNAGDVYLNLKGEKLRNGNNQAGIFYSGALHLNQAYQPSSIVKEYSYTTDYILCSPDFTTPSYYAITAMLYGRSIGSNKPVWLGALQKNHSYIWKLKLKNKDPWYLYNDGTIGSLAKRGSRTPIGVVVKEKASESAQGTAIALKDVSSGTTFTYTTPYNWAKMNTQHNTTHYTDANDGINDMDGYKWTYEAAGSVDGRIKANFEADYTPFYKAAQYNPGVAVTGSNVGKWYVPALGEWALAWKAFGKWDGNIPSGGILTMSVSAMNSAFTAAGGDNLYNYGYWTCTEYEGSMRPALSVGGTGFYINLNATHNLVDHVRPFVHF